MAVVKQIAVTTYDGAVYTHRVLMRTADEFLKKSLATPRGSYYSALSATLFAWMAFEAYLNTVIDHLDPKTFKNERNFFRGKKYGGTFGKWRWILEQLNIAPSRTAERRRRVVMALHRLRNQLVHAGPSRYDGTRVHAVEDDPPMIEEAWVETRVRVPQVRRYVGAVRDLCEWLNARVRPRFDDPHLRRSAFKGSSQSQTSSTTIKKGRLSGIRVAAK